MSRQPGYGAWFLSSLMLAAVATGLSGFFVRDVPGAELPLVPYGLVGGWPFGFIEVRRIEFNLFFFLLDWAIWFVLLAPLVALLWKVYLRLHRNLERRRGPGETNGER